MSKTRRATLVIRRIPRWGYTMDSKQGQRSAARRSRGTEGMEYLESSSLIIGGGESPVRAMTRPGKRTRSSLTPCSTLTASASVPGNSSNAAEVRSRPASAKPSSSPEASTHRHPIVPTRTRIVSRSAARSQMISTLGCIRTWHPLPLYTGHGKGLCSSFLGLA